MRRKLDAKAGLQQFHILQILLGRDITVSVAEHLDFWRQAAHADAVDDAPPVESHSREDPVRAIFHPIYAIAIAVKDDGVNVDLEPRSVCENEVGSRAPMLEFKTSAFQNFPQFGEVSGAQDYIDILVWPSLRAENRIDRPAAVEPLLNSSVLE